MLDFRFSFASHGEDFTWLKIGSPQRSSRKSSALRKKAIVAVAASILTIVYYMIRDGTPYRDLGIPHFDQRDRSRAARHFVARLQQLGYNVQITEGVA